MSNNKFERFEQQHEQMQFVIASNRLPDCANPANRGFEDMWEPMLRRMRIVELKASFPGTKDFPYSAVELAAAITQMINEHPNIKLDEED